MPANKKQGPWPFALATPTKLRSKVDGMQTCIPVRAGRPLRHSRAEPCPLYGKIRHAFAAVFNLAQSCCCVFQSRTHVPFSKPGVQAALELSSACPTCTFLCSAAPVCELQSKVCAASEQKFSTAVMFQTCCKPVIAVLMLNMSVQA